jgi:hypothetical protein
MTQITRRMVLRNSLAVAAAGSLGRPFIANAAASTATAWWTQGFVPEEDAAFKKLVDDYQKQSGNTINYSIIPFAPLNQKTVSALTSGDVPDLIDINTDVLVPQNAWDDKMVDVSDVVGTQKDAYHPTVYLATQYYNIGGDPPHRPHRFSCAEGETSTIAPRSFRRMSCRTKLRSSPFTSGPTRLVASAAAARRSPAAARPPGGGRCGSPGWPR